MTSCQCIDQKDLIAENERLKCEVKHLRHIISTIHSLSEGGIKCHLTDEVQRDELEEKALTKIEGTASNNNVSIDNDRDTNLQMPDKSSLPAGEPQFPLKQPTKDSNPMIQQYTGTSSNMNAWGDDSEEDGMIPNNINYTPIHPRTVRPPPAKFTNTQPAAVPQGSVKTIVGGRGERYLEDMSGAKFIAPSLRGDGSMRPPIKVRPGYSNPEEAPRYVIPQKRNGGIQMESDGRMSAKYTDTIHNTDIPSIPSKPAARTDAWFSESDSS